MVFEQNFDFLKTNRLIGEKALSEYLKQLQNHKTVPLDDSGMDEILRCHFIDDNLLRTNQYFEFVESRRSFLIDQISRTMGKAVSTGEAVADDSDDDEISGLIELGATHEQPVLEAKLPPEAWLLTRSGWQSP